MADKLSTAFAMIQMEKESTKKQLESCYCKKLLPQKFLFQVNKFLYRTMGKEKVFFT